MLNRSEARRRAENQQRIVESRIGRYIRGEISATCLVNCPWRKTYQRKKSPKNSPSEFVMHRPRQSTAADKIKFKVRPPFKNTINVKNTSFVSMVDDLKRLKLDDCEASGLKSASKPPVQKFIANTNTKPVAAEIANKSHRKLDATAAGAMNEKIQDAFKRAPVELRKLVSSNYSEKISSSRVRSSASSKYHRSRKHTSHLDVSSRLSIHDNNDNEYINHLLEPCRCLADPDMDSFCMCQDDTFRRIIPEPGWYLKEIKKKLHLVRNNSSKNKSVVSPVLSLYNSHTDGLENFEYWQCN